MAGRCRCPGQYLQTLRAAVPCLPNRFNSGVAVHTLGNHPIHGVRHKPAGNTNGWYIWAGEYSSAPDFFSPLHTAHMLEKASEVLNFLGLSPGCRFLLAKDYADVWFDSALLDT